jgi:hypothetical protein
MRRQDSRLLATLVVLVPTMAPDIARAATLAELAEWCGNSAERREVLCDTYLETIIEGLGSTDPVMNGGNRMCIPPEADRAEIIRLTRAYAAQSGAANDMSALDGVGTALRGRYPCR